MQYFISQIFFTVNKLIGEADYLVIIYLSMFSFRGSDSWNNLQTLELGPSIQVCKLFQLLEHRKLNILK